MRLRSFIAIFVLAPPISCHAANPSQDVPLCDISKLQSKTLEATSDTQGVNFRPYATSLVATIRQNWYSRIPPVAMPPVSKIGCVAIDFEILKDGTISALHYKLSSGDTTLDSAAFDAINAASPVEALPSDFRAPSVHFQFTFRYNLSPEVTSQASSRDISSDDLSYRYAAVTVSDKGPGISKPISSSEDQNQIIQLGTPIHAINPLVPKSLYGKNAAAVLGATITTDGAFIDLLGLGGERDFEEAAMDAVHQWQYRPSTLKGNPVEAKVFITFLLNQGEIKTSIEPDPPLPDGPKRNMRELYSKGELFAVDMQHVKPPKAIYSPDPEYSQAARTVKRQGAILLGVILGRDGLPDDVWVIRKFVYPNGEQKTFKAVGLGLEQKAIEAVWHWRFEPAMKDGEPVPVFLNIEVNFHLY